MIVNWIRSHRVFLCLFLLLSWEKLLNGPNIGRSWSIGNDGRGEKWNSLG
jgi:hypothetical protein